MRRNTVRIKDRQGSAFLMTVWTPSGTTNLKFWNCDRTRYQVSDWETSDKGSIRFEKGDALLAARNSPKIPGYCFSGAGFGIFNDLYVGGPDAIAGHDYEDIQWGIVLRDYVDRSGAANDDGVGEIRQPWVLAFKPGAIIWELAND